MSAIPATDQPADLVAQQLQSLQLDSVPPAKTPQTHQTRPRPHHQPHPQSHPQPYQPYAQPYTPYQHFQAPYAQYLPYSPYPEHMGWQGAPGSEQTSPVSANNPPFGMWTSQSVSPVNSRPPFLSQQSRHASFDEYAGMQGPAYYSARNSYGGPSTAWPSPSMPSSYGFFTPYQQQPGMMEPAIRPPEWSTSPVNSYGPNIPSVSPGGSKPSPTPTDVKEAERKAYHPQAPSRRSDWVMWVGNVPNNTSHEELWHFFNMTVPITNTEIDAEPWRGPSSIFLISRSSCAFVNLSSQVDLDRAVAYFNGQALRPWDSRCPRMVCRVRRRDDDLRSGVGAQRGVGMHRDWVKKKKEEEVAAGAEDAIVDLNAVRPESTAEKSLTGVVMAEEKKCSSGSYASTSSSFLIKNFPRRVFILKSLTTAELEESVKTGLWKTQRHNEPILDQAFRTSQGVFLIFGANRAGEFFGYARMIEPINKNTTSKASISSTPKRSATGESDRFMLSPFHSRVTTSSPGEFTSRGDSYFQPLVGHRKTDPPKIPNHAAEPGSMSELPTLDESRAHTFDPKTLQRDRFLPNTMSLAEAAEAEAKVQSEITFENARQGTLPPAQENAKREKQEAQEEFADDGWGQHFRIEWIKVAPLPFGRTRHLRNPWNADREVKVSRDGTEVEPTVGMQLMAQWDQPDSIARNSPDGLVSPSSE